MIILHATFSAPYLHLWAEESNPTSTPRKGAKKSGIPSASANTHPFAATASQIEESLKNTGRWSAPAKIRRTPLKLRLPSLTNRPLASSPLIAAAPDSKTKAKLQVWEVNALSLPIVDALPLLGAVLEHNPLGTGLLAGADLLFWAQTMRFAGSLVAKQAYLPDVVVQETGACHARWKPVLSEADAARAAQLAAGMPFVARSTVVGFRGQAPEAGANIAEFVDSIVDFVVRSQAKVANLTPSNNTGLHERWIQALLAPNGKFQASKAEIEAFLPELQRWKRPLDIETGIPWRLCFRLEEPPTSFDENGEPKLIGDAEWNVRYLLQARDEPSLQVPLEQAWKPKTVGARLMSQSGFNAAEYLLTALGRASAACPPVGASLQGHVPNGFSLDTDGAFNFLSHDSHSLEQAGFGVFLPAWWSRHGKKTPLSAQAKARTPKFQGSSGLTLDALVEFDWEVALGDQNINLSELQALARMQSPLVHFRGQWVQLNQKQLQSAVEFWQKRGGQQAKARDLLFLALGATSALGENGGGLGTDSEIEISGVAATGWLHELLNRLTSETNIEPIAPPAGFQGQLRPYQQTGFSWMNFLRPLGLGACLADDMGLGKTVQVLALLQRQWEAMLTSGKTKPTLLICPTSVVANWYKEAARFTPELPIVVHHGAGREKGDFKALVEKSAIVISSYALLHRDAEQFKSLNWSGLILDEAQNIKNSETKQAKAARALEADYRIAMTGTPVENNIGDLWSLMEFLNPGLLGTQSQFRKRFFIPIQSDSDPAAIEKLKKLTGPFILRRLKTDKSVISDLPDKMEMKVFCQLTREQASLYTAVVDDALSDVEESDGIERRGKVLGMIAKLKQVCNHPAHFSKDNTVLTGRSGKLERLTEMMEEVLASGDNTLIFTQFSEMGELLRTHLQETFAQEVLFLHGGTTKKARDLMVERFQKADDPNTPRIFILSLKAGGVGLNLTRANHVFHFDRWWNPAIENQATDRAFRIGQTKNVQVHKFLCAGTLEERIDEMIESKQALATNVLGTGEKWLTELSITQLRELLTLRADAISD